MQWYIIPTTKHVFLLRFTPPPPDTPPPLNRLQDDTDDSDDDNGGVSARHSWYTANRQRGGHAPDIQHANSMARAAALARVRNAIKKASQTGVMGGTGEDLPSGTSEIPPTIDGLPSSARARHHRSPSWTADDKEGGSGAVADSSRSMIDAGDNEAKKTRAAVDYHHLHSPPMPSRSAIGSESHSSRRDHIQKAAAVPKGAVRARQHRSPSRSLEGGRGPSLASEVADALAILATKKTTHTAADDTLASTRDCRERVDKSGARTTGEGHREKPRSRVSVKNMPSSFGSSEKINKESPSPRVSRKSSATIATSAASTGKQAQQHVGRGGAGVSRRSNLNMLSSAATMGEKKSIDHENVPSARDSHPNVEGSISSLIRNHVPFLRGSSPTAAAPASPVEPPVVRERRPSVGPVNPRAMYGQEAPPLPEAHVTTSRRPSSVIMPLPSPPDDGNAAGSFSSTSSTRRLPPPGRNARISDAECRTVLRSSDGDKRGTGEGATATDNVSAQKRAATNIRDGRASDSVQRSGSDRRRNSDGDRLRKIDGNASSGGRSSPSSSSGLSSTQQNITPSPAADGLERASNLDHFAGGDIGTVKSEHRGDIVDDVARRGKDQDKKKAIDTRSGSSDAATPNSGRSPNAAHRPKKSGDTPSKKNVGGDADVDEPDDKPPSWEDQLRTMAGVAVSPGTGIKHENIGISRVSSQKERQVRRPVACT